jgi:hypothetical protein
MQSTAVTFVRLPRASDLWHAARANLDWLAAVTAGVNLYIWRASIAGAFAAKEWGIGDFYSAVFDWASIQAAFLFGVYAFFLSRSEPFLQAIAPSPAFKLLRRYVVRTLYLSMALSVVSLPLLVASPAMSGTGEDLAFAVFLLISVLLTYTFFCFLKVIRVFGKIERRS